ncbi:MAG: response regulator transcription factor [Chloroflexota bacterium]
MKRSILLIEDDLNISEQIVLVLRRANFNVDFHFTAEKGLKAAQEKTFDLILLDVMVPVMGGWELCRRLRETVTVPLIFITALNRPEDVVRGLNLGADDYLVKPFDMNVLLARIEANLRRTPIMEEEAYVFGDNEITIDRPAHTVTVRGEKVDFTPREFSLLATMASYAGRVVPTNDLLAQAWGEGYRDTPENIKPYIHYLRKKIEEDPTNPRWINTVRGVGYRFGT